MVKHDRRPRIIRAFLAAPRDTSEEKAALSRAVEAINRVTGRSEHFRIELLHWSTDTYPAIGPDAQSVVNDQIGDYEILIVVLNKEFGTRTPRANSGTEEEYDRAFLKYLENNLSIRILVYFADPFVRLHSVDPITLAQIKSFRTRLEKEGVLYAVYQDASDFERLVSTQLTSACREFLSGAQALGTPRPNSSAGPQTLRQPNWVAESRLALPQSANYISIDLSPFRRRFVRLRGHFQSQS